jgi:putative ABC transport system permease protein
MATLFADVRYAMRLLSKAPGFALAVVIVIALGIGANSAIFTLVDKTVIRPLPYRDSDRLAMLWEDFSAFGTPTQRVSPATFLDWRGRNQVFESMGALLGSAMNLSGGGAPEQVLGVAVTSNLIPTLGVSPILGRTFSASEEAPGTREVILSFRLWQRRFGGDRSLVGQIIQMNGEKYTVIGVMPQGFHFPDHQTDYWLPFGLSPQLLNRRNSHFLKVVGRLKRSRDWQQAQADMNALAEQLKKEFPNFYDRIGIKVVPLKEDVLGDRRNIFIILLAAAGCVLMIACANVANLSLARASGRKREIAVRTALGASQMRVVRQILTENLLLSCTGGALGLLFAHWGSAILQKLVPGALSASVELHLDVRIVVFGGLLSVLTGLLFGLAPALQLKRSEIYGVTRSGLGVMSHESGLRDALVVGEVAIALVLLVGAVLLMETLANMRAVDPGFRSAGMLTADIEAPQPRYSDSSKWHRFYGDILAQVKGIPGVKSVGLSSDLPYTSRGNTMFLSIEGKPQRADLGQDALFRLVSADYLQTIGAKLKEGRFLEERDSERSMPVVVINGALARQYWPSESALGHRIDTGTGGGTTRWMTIVGVIADIRERGLDLTTKPAVYVPYSQTEITFFQPSEITVLTTSREPLSLSKELQRAVWSVDAEQPVARITTLDAIVDGELADRSQVLQLLGAFAALALTLAALGIYGVLFYVVSQRTREIGLRMAIGASRWDVVRDILAYSVGLTAYGLAAGIAAAAVTTRLLSRLLYEVSPVDAKAIIIVSILLMLVAMLASYLPTRKAASVDPAIALRQD